MESKKPTINLGQEPKQVHSRRFYYNDHYTLISFLLGNILEN